VQEQHNLGYVKVIVALTIPACVYLSAVIIPVQSSFAGDLKKQNK
jgi:TRAP-type uncharacterized transport system fused permease subunit